MEACVLALRPHDLREAKPERKKDTTTLGNGTACTGAGTCPRVNGNDQRGNMVSSWYPRIGERAKENIEPNAS